MEGIGDTIQALEALGQDSCLQERPSTGRPEGSRTGQFKFNIKCRCQSGPTRVKFGAVTRIGSCSLD